MVGTNCWQGERRLRAIKLLAEQEPEQWQSLTALVYVKNSRVVKELLSKTVESCRKASGIRTSEIVGGQGEPPMPHPYMMP